MDELFAPFGTPSRHAINTMAMAPSIQACAKQHARPSASGLLANTTSSIQATIRTLSHSHFEATTQPLRGCGARRERHDQELSRIAYSSAGFNGTVWRSKGLLTTLLASAPAAFQHLAHQALDGVMAPRPTGMPVSTQHSLVQVSVLGRAMSNVKPTHLNMNVAHLSQNLDTKHLHERPAGSSFSW